MKPPIVTPENSRRAFVRPSTLPCLAALAVLFLLCVAAHAVYAGPTDADSGKNDAAASSQEDAGNWKDETPDAKALRELKLRAGQGDAKAQCELGCKYLDGWAGVAKNDRKALGWWRKAADQGYMDAQNNVGFMYSTGRGVPQNSRKAVEWFRKAAEQGLADAQENLGHMYAKGRGVAKDERTAAQWFQKAADQGDCVAQYELGNRYAAGRGIAKDERKAAQWYLKAAKHGVGPAREALEKRFTGPELAAMADWYFFRFCETASGRQITDAVRRGANVAVRNSDGETPLMRAAGGNPHPDAITALVKAGADVNAKDDEGNTPLMLAAKGLGNPNPKVIAVLVKAGADVNAKDNEGVTPLMRTAKLGHRPEVTTALLKAGADINVTDNWGETALMWAVRSETFQGFSPRVFMILLDFGADTKVKDSDGRTALDYAKANQDLRMPGSPRSAVLKKLEAMSRSRRLQ